MNRDKVHAALIGAIVNFYCNIFGFKVQNLKNNYILPKNNTQGYNSLTLIMLR